MEGWETAELSEKLSESPTREVRRSKRNKGSEESVGSETPAERSRRLKEEKEPPDKYTPCQICRKWECDNVSNPADPRTNTT